MALARHTATRRWSCGSARSGCCREVRIAIRATRTSHGGLKRVSPDFVVLALLKWTVPVAGSVYSLLGPREVSANDS